MTPSITSRRIRKRRCTAEEVVLIISAYRNDVLLISGDHPVQTTCIGVLLNWKRSIESESASVKAVATGNIRRVSGSGRSKNRNHHGININHWSCGGTTGYC